MDGRKKWNEAPPEKHFTETFTFKDLERKEIGFDVSSKDLKSHIVLNFDTRSVSIELIKGKSEIFSLTTGFPENDLKAFAVQLIGAGYEANRCKKLVSFVGSREKKKREKEREKGKSKQEKAPPARLRRPPGSQIWVPRKVERKKGRVRERIEKAIKDGTWRD